MPTKKKRGRPKKTEAGGLHYYHLPAKEISQHDSIMQVLENAAVALLWASDLIGVTPNAVKEVIADMASAKRMSRTIDELAGKKIIKRKIKRSTTK